TPSAREARISPVGALLKNASVVPEVARVLRPSVLAGTGPAALNAATCCSGAVSHAASLAASSLCFEVLETPRKEPPQLPAPPGKTSAKSQPVLASPPPASTFSLTTPSIQPGQTKVAKEPSTKDLPPPQSQAAWLAVRPSC